MDEEEVVKEEVEVEEEKERMEREGGEGERFGADTGELAALNLKRRVSLNRNVLC